MPAGGACKSGLRAPLAGLYVLYFLTVDWYHHERRESEVMNNANMVLQRVNAPTLLQYPTVLPERHYWLNMLVTFLTLGLWGFISTYRYLVGPKLSLRGPVALRGQASVRDCVCTEPAMNHR